MNKTWRRRIAVINMLSGLTILAAVLIPMLSYEVKSSSYEKLLSPIPESKALEYMKPADLTKASNWFDDGKEEEDFKQSSVTSYTISIPRLGIENANTIIGGEDLTKSLIHYPGTALPGKIGNAVIFGHSSLPILFSSTNYKTIFSTLPTLDLGDEIYVDYDGISYKYVIEDMFEVLPTELWVLEQNQSDSYISLITCVPPGHPLKPRRLVVLARIVPIHS